MRGNLDFSEIKTGNGIDRDLIATTNDRLKKTIIEVNNLIKAIKVFNKQSAKQTKTLINLTWGIIILTMIMIIGLIVQIILVL